MTPTSAPASEGAAPADAHGGETRQNQAPAGEAPTGEAPTGEASESAPAREYPLRLEDFQLIQRIRRGEAAAFEDLVDRYGDDLFGLAFSLVGNRADAEDVLQQALLGAYRRIDSFEGRSSLKTWLVRILVNQASKARRSRRVRRSIPLDAGRGDGRGDGRGEGGNGANGVVVTTGPATAAVDSRLDLLAMLEELSPDHREILLLRETQQLSYDEIAEALGVPRGTVESRLFRARQELRRKFANYFA
jgi:RNA polymerase sigma-70 factor (ECF subfamily)